ncbi:MAG: type I restriction endonuclease subunit R [Bacilli bacterium]|jgi:type I restriction enzyme R subunit|nr:type I restriction endonuclease subunit R [Bacilli bacterium]MCH4235390.1 type I restriction endonuclease subunit R [Bacilli bacterium]
MPNITGEQTELELENELIKQLRQQFHSSESEDAFVSVHDDSSLYKNLRKQIDRLNGICLSDTEFRRFVNELEKYNTVYKCAINLRQMQTITMDNGEKKNIKIFEKNDWCRNIVQVAHQINQTNEFAGRFDVTILVNGLPLVQIELKKNGITLAEAFGQIERYRRTVYKGIFKYIQFFIISNGSMTKYFANSDRTFKKENVFTWSDPNNVMVNRLNEFAMDRLTRCNICRTISNYIVINKTERDLMILRPYQIWAVENLVDRALNTKNNGFVWHTTGSGKTLTSFKLAQCLRDTGKFSKVVFLVDRRDLDRQTVRNFNSFEKDAVVNVGDSRKLNKFFGDSSVKMITTTIQKMSNLCTNPRFESTVEKNKDTTIFIIDECHRSNFGEMRKHILRAFPSAQMFGFTGTPIFAENMNATGLTTEAIFGGKPVHSYKIKDAINAHMVLGFNVQYFKTIDIVTKVGKDEQVEAIDEDELINSPTRITNISKHIIDNFDKLTVNRKYNAIFAVSSIDLLMKYYDELKKQNEALEENQKIKIATIFTYSPNSIDTEELGANEMLAQQSLQYVMDDYSKVVGKNYSIANCSEYFEDVRDAFREGKVELILVVNMMLTGFDSKRINTLFLDKSLKYHGLIQAFSRTNRLDCSAKQFGNIICYRTTPKDVEKAVALYSQEDHGIVLMKSFEEYLDLFRDTLKNLRSYTITPDDVDSLEGDTAKIEFVNRFRKVARYLICLQNFCEFSFPITLKDDITSDEYNSFKSRYLEIYNEFKKHPEKVSVIGEVTFDIELVQTDKVDVDYILNLLRKLGTVGGTKVDISAIINILRRSTDPILVSKRELLESFITNVFPTLAKGASVDDELAKYIEEKRKETLSTISDDLLISYEALEKLLNRYDYFMTIDYTDIKSLLNKRVKERYREKHPDLNPIKATNELMEEIKNYIIEIADKYSMHN